MVPMADLLNHVTGANNARLFYHKDRLEVGTRLAVTFVVNVRLDAEHMQHFAGH